MNEAYGYGGQNQGMMQGNVYGGYQNQSVPSAQMIMPTQGHNPFTAQQTRYGLRGHYIQNPEEIQAGEVPMDGSVSFFPMSDNSAIIGKMWGKDGLIKEVRYIPDTIVEEKLKAFQANQSATITATLNTILDKISKIESSLNS